MKLLPLVFSAMLLLSAGCSEESTNPNAGAETGPPEIISLSAEKTHILYGGQDPAVITCNATGGNLSYTWAVDLGDIIPLNAERSKVSFNGSACCVGEKVITCTVTNSKGSATKTIVITILEEIKQPEIITIETDKSTISAGAGEHAALVCYAIGGNLAYAWESDCGDIVVDAADPSKATLAATAGCAGERTVTCTVSNEKGSAAQSVKITVRD